MPKRRNPSKWETGGRFDDQSKNQYFHEISKIPLLSKEKETSLAQMSFKGDIKARQKLVQANLRFVISVAKQYQNQGMLLQDLISDGNVGLCKASKRFDPSLGFRFISYAVWWIRQSIMASLAKNSRIVRIPKNRFSNLSKIDKLSKNLEQVLGRVPSANEIADFSDEFDEQDVIDNQLMKNTHLSINSKLIAGESNLLLEDQKYVYPDEKMSNDELKVIISKLLDSLTPREAKVLTLCMGLNGQKKQTLKEIGIIFSLTRERIGQIKEKGIDRLRHSSRACYLLEFYED